MRYFVGNLPWATTTAQLLELFNPFGCTAAEVIAEAGSGRALGFGFVDIPDDRADACRAEMDGRMYAGRALKVQPARPRRG
ncbi:MAG TPA: hypothetical protein VMV27_00690 [Candidatus Binataceae bacterium]|nr:hypothetical protein [Candidatus Binataceae bacterium]